ncbi:MAG TPA: MFS transporter [Ktedonobacterales bacterium]|jgi:MFS family permease
MAQRAEVVAVYGAGVVQGIALVTFPAASAVFTSPQYYNLTSTQYGAMFLPQALTAIMSALLGAGMARSLGAKRIFALGLVANLLSMLLLVLSQLAIGHGSLAYLMLLLATTSLGLGFGLTVPALNTLAASFFPERADSAVLILNALLGLGTALAPVFVALFTGLGFWWGLPLCVAILLAGLLAFSLRLPLRSGELTPTETHGAPALPRRFWIFAAFALLYGIVETMNGNWATLYMTKSLGASATAASVALTAFWGMVTVGRLFFAFIEEWVPERRTYVLLPFVIALAFELLSRVQPGSVAQGILAFGLAGLGCSALLPLTISFGQNELTAIAASVSGYIIAFYQMGYGLAAFGVGPLQENAGLSLSALYGWAAFVALGLGALALIVVRGWSQPVKDTQRL